jgi:hypothetical protein
LPSLSQIEIDKSKKVFDNVNMHNELNKIRRLKHIKYVTDKDSRGDDVQKMIVPNFFNMISDADEYRVFTKFDTPLDILQDILTFEPSVYKKGKNNKDLIDLLVKSKDLDGKYNKDSAEAIFKIIEEYGKKINGLKLKTCTLNDKARSTVEKKYKREAKDKLKLLTPNDSTILSVLKQCFGDKEEDKFGFKKYSMLTLNLLFISKKIQVLKCFKNNDIKDDEILIRIKGKYDYDIFGDKYQKILLKDIFHD